MPSHQFWRLNITAVCGNATNVDVYEWRFYDSSHVEISRSGGTAAASSAYFIGHEADKAFDGIAGSKWISNAGPSVSTPQWLAYQFPASVDVSYITISAPDVADPGPGDFDLQYSDDGSSWTTLYSYFGVGWPSDGVVNTFNAANAAPTSVGIYWRVNVTGTGGVGAVGMAALTFKNGAGTVIPTTTYSAAASSVYEGYGPANVFDGSAGTFWDASTVPSSGSPITITYWFGSVVQVATVCITARADGFYNSAPHDFDVQYSYDNASWTTVASFAGLTWTAGLEQCVSLSGTFPITVPTVPPQNVRGNVDWDQVKLVARHGDTYGIQIQYSDGTHTTGAVPVFKADGTLTNSGIGGGTIGTTTLPISVNGPATVSVNGTGVSFDDTVLINGA